MDASSFATLISDARESYLVRDVELASELYTKTEEVLRDQLTGAYHTAKTIEYIRASCGHVTTDAIQLVRCALCPPEILVCIACSTRCAGFCNQVLCASHAKKFRGEFYCSIVLAAGFLSQEA
jgi:hypothetical protein